MKLAVMIFIILMSQLSLRAWPPYGDGLSEDEQFQFCNFSINSSTVEELIDAVKRADLSKLQELHEQGISLATNTLDDTSKTALLLYAVQKASKKSRTYHPIVYYLLQCNINPNLADSDGVTPLMVAAGSTRIKSEEIVRLLLLSNAKVNLYTPDGNSALLQAQTSLNNAQSSSHKTRAQNIFNMLRITSALEQLEKLRPVENVENPETV